MERLAHALWSACHAAVRFLSTGLEYRFAVFENPYALPAIVVPREIAKGHPRYNGGATAPATVGGKPWFADILNDPEWIRDPTKKARDEAMTVIAELEARRAQPPAE